MVACPVKSPERGLPEVAFNRVKLMIEGVGNFQLICLELLISDFWLYPPISDFRHLVSDLHVLSYDPEYLVLVCTENCA